MPNRNHSSLVNKILDDDDQVSAKIIGNQNSCDD